MTSGDRFMLYGSFITSGALWVALILGLVVFGKHRSVGKDEERAGR